MHRSGHGKYRFLLETVFNILEGTLKIILANPEQVKALCGKKTDPNDSRWLASLLRHGLVQGSFIPPRDIRELRDLTRRRRTLVGEGAAEPNRVQKVLEDANVKIGNVLSDVFGTFRSGDAGSVIGKQTERRRNCPIGTLELGTKDSPDHRSVGRPSNDRSSALHDHVITQADTCVPATPDIALNPPPARNSQLKSFARPACRHRQVDISAIWTKPLLR